MCRATKVRTHTHTHARVYRQELYKYKQNIKCTLPLPASPPLHPEQAANVTLFRLANVFSFLFFWGLLFALSLSLSLTMVGIPAVAHYRYSLRCQKYENCLQLDTLATLVPPAPPALITLFNYSLFLCAKCCTISSDVLYSVFLALWVCSTQFYYIVFLFDSPYRSDIIVVCNL